MGYSPKIWGKEGWHFIHMTALNFPLEPTEEDRKNYMQFLESLQFVLPCEGCAYNWSEKLKTHPPKMENRDEFFRWTVDMHNQVNVSNGKKEINYEDALKRLDEKRKLESLKDSFVLTSALAGITAIFYSLYKVFKK